MAFQFEERTGEGMEAERVAFLEDDAGFPQISTTKGSGMARSPSG
jgi:hypothetical protein